MSALVPGILVFSRKLELMVFSTSCSLLHCWAPSAVEERFPPDTNLSWILGNPLSPIWCLCPGASFPHWAVSVAAALSAIALPALVLLLFPQRDSCSVETSPVWNQLYLKQSQFEENSLFFHYGNVYLKATDSMIKTSDSEYSTQKSFLALWFGKQLKRKIWNNPELGNIEINTCRVHQKCVLQFSC